MRKYKLLRDDCTNYNGRTLYRIMAVRSFGGVKRGQMGGYVECEHNLFHNGLCWIGNDSRVFDAALVGGDARVYGNAEVFGGALVDGYAEVFGDTLVGGYARVRGNATVFGNAEVYDNVRVADNAKVSGYAQLSGNALVSGNAGVSGDAKVFGSAKAYGNARVNGNAQLFGDMIATRHVYSSNTHKHIITLSDNHISIGCEAHTIEYWKKHIEEVGRDRGYSDKQIKATKKILNGMLMFRAS